MRTKSVFVKLLLLASIALVIAGCNQPASTGTAGTSGSSSSSSEGTDTNVGVPTVDVGFVGVMTGGGADIGTRLQAGFQMAVNDINEEGQMRINVHYEDSQAKNDLAVTAINKLIDVHKVPIVVGLWTGPNLAMAPISEKNKVLQINPGAQGDGLLGANPYLFNTLPTLKMEEAKLAEYLYHEKGARTAAIFYQNDATGQPAMEDFKIGFEEVGGTIVGTEAVSIDQTDFRTSIAKVLNNNPDVIFLGTTGNLLPLVMQIKQAGFEGIISGNSWVTSPELAMNEMSQGILHTQVYYNPPEDIKKRYEEIYGENMDFWAHQGYDAAVLIKNIILRLIEEGKEITGENARQVILEQREFDGLSSKLVFDPETNTASVTIEIRELQGNGEDKVIKTIEAGQ